jgi:hypothetical protein
MRHDPTRALPVSWYRPSPSTGDSDTLPFPVAHRSSGTSAHTLGKVAKGISHRTAGSRRALLFFPQPAIHPSHLAGQGTSDHCAFRMSLPSARPALSRSPHRQLSPQDSSKIPPSVSSCGSPIVHFPFRPSHTCHFCFSKIPWLFSLIDRP